MGTRDARPRLHARRSRADCASVATLCCVGKSSAAIQLCQERPQKSLLRVHVVRGAVRAAEAGQVSPAVLLASRVRLDVRCVPHESRQAQRKVANMDDEQEVAALERIVKELEPLDAPTRERVLRWAYDRFGTKQ